MQPVPALGAPLDIHVIDGEVVFVGPGAIAFAMTRAAAEETCRRLQAMLVSPPTDAGND
jgi:hypothetical protein